MRLQQLLADLMVLAANKIDRIKLKPSTIRGNNFMNYEGFLYSYILLTYIRITNELAKKSTPYRSAFYNNSNKIKLYFA